MTNRYPSGSAADLAVQWRHVAARPHPRTRQERRHGVSCAVPRHPAELALGPARRHDREPHEGVVQLGRDRREPAVEAARQGGRTTAVGISTVRASKRCATSSRRSTPGPARFTGPRTSRSTAATTADATSPRAPLGSAGRGGPVRRARAAGRTVRAAPGPAEDPALLAGSGPLEHERWPQAHHAQVGVQRDSRASSDRSTYAFSRRYAAAEVPSVAHDSSTSSSCLAGSRPRWK